MIRIKHIDHIVLRVHDADAMIAFYCDLLGCSVERRVDEIGLIQLRAGSCILDLVPVDSPLGKAGGAPPQRDGHNVDHFCLRVEPFDPPEIFRHLEANHVKASQVLSRYGAEGSGPSINIQDPEGNNVELKGPPFSTQASPVQSGGH
ncbi:MAG TPA: VOC family protein [Telluria sp.]|nr:VOC family protein [Telluria sp.]